MPKIHVIYDPTDRSTIATALTVTSNIRTASIDVDKNISFEALELALEELLDLFTRANFNVIKGKSDETNIHD